MQRALIRGRLVVCLGALLGTAWACSGGSESRGVPGPASRGGTGAESGAGGAPDEPGGSGGGGSGGSGGTGGSSGGSGGDPGAGGSSQGASGGSDAATGGESARGPGGDGPGGDGPGGAPPKITCGLPPVEEAAGAAGEAGATQAAKTEALSISDFVIEPNPDMPLSCFVSWTTSEATGSEVDFGETDYELRIRDPKPTTAHRVLVIGMHADTSYRIKAISGNAQGSCDAESTFVTGSLPALLPLPTLLVNEPERSQRGWTLMNVEAGKTNPAFVVMVDELGLPVWYFVNGTNADSRGDIATELVGDHVIVGPAQHEPTRELDLAGRVVWEGPVSGSFPSATHEFAKTSRGNYLYNIDLHNAVTVDSVKLSGAMVQEITPDGTVVWSWKLFDHVDPGGTRNDFCHGNAIDLDETTDTLYYNCRFLGLFKIDRASGDILWRLGGVFDPTTLGPGDFTFDPPSAQFSDAHDPELHADGTLLLYDNGGYQDQPPGEHHSRVVEYQLDETAMTATRTFEFPGDFSVDDWYRSWYTPIWGDADRLANGNILVTAGTRSGAKGSRIFEVTREGEVVWTLEYPPGNGCYRADRLSPPPLVERIP